MYHIQLDDCICQIRFPKMHAYHIRLALHKNGVHVVRDLIRKNPDVMATWHGMGPKYVEFIQNSLKSYYGLRLGMTDEEITSYEAHEWMEY